MKRRDLLTVLGSAAIALPLAVEAIGVAPPVIGLLHGASASAFSPFVDAFRSGLSSAGYVDGRNVLLDYRWAEGHAERLQALAADLVSRRVALIVACSGVNAALAAKAATSSIPIVFCSGADPVRSGLVKTLSRPGGNMTGVFMMEDALQVKRLELLHELAPAVRNIATLINPANALAEAQWADIHAAAETVGLRAQRFDVMNDGDVDRAFEAIHDSRAWALVIAADSFFTSRRERIVALAAWHKMPAVFYLREYVAAGGLMSYGVSLAQLYQRAGVYAADILKGAKPQDLPVAAPTKFDLVINLKTAKALGLQVPTALLARADEFIQ